MTHPLRVACAASFVLAACAVAHAADEQPWTAQRDRIKAGMEKRLARHDETSSWQAAQIEVRLAAAEHLFTATQECMGRMFLVRPAGERVIVSCPDYEVRTIALRTVGVDVVVPAGASAAVRQAADSLARAIAAKGGEAKVIEPDAVKIENTHFDAVIARKVNVNKVPVEYSNKVAVFDNRPLATSRNLIIIGSEATNPLMKHLGAVNTFTYDKVLEKITSEYPGAGRGLIGVVESVNDPSFDPTGQTRDALVVGGSDEAGTLLAVKKLEQLISDMK